MAQRGHHRAATCVEIALAMLIEQVSVVAAHHGRVIAERVAVEDVGVVIDLRLEGGFLASALCRFDHDQSVRVSSPASAISAARSMARALLCVSCHSASGSESATMPAPACTWMLPSLTTAVRMAMAMSISP